MLLGVGIVVVVVVVDGVGIAGSVEGGVWVVGSCKGLVTGVWEWVCVELKEPEWEEVWLLGCVEFRWDRIVVGL